LKNNVNFSNASAAIVYNGAFLRVNRYFYLIAENTDLNVKRFIYTTRE